LKKNITKRKNTDSTKKIKKLSNDKTNTLADALNDYIVHKEYRRRIKNDSKILGQLSLEKINQSIENTKKEKQLREAFEIFRKKDMEEKKQKKRSEEKKDEINIDLRKKASEKEILKKEQDQFLKEVETNLKQEIIRRKEIEDTKKLEEELLLRSKMEEVRLKDLIKFKNRYNLEVELREAEENARKWSITEEMRIAQEKKSRWIEEQWHKNKKKISEKNIKNLKRNNLKTVIKQKNHSFNTISSERTIINNDPSGILLDTLERKLIKDQKLDDLANNFHAFIESKEDFKSKAIKDNKELMKEKDDQKLDDLANNFHAFIESKEDFKIKAKENYKRKYELIKFAPKEIINESFEPKYKTKINEKIENLASLLNKIAISNKSQIKDVDSKNNVVSLVKDITIPKEKISQDSGLGNHIKIKEGIFNFKLCQNILMLLKKFY